MLAPLPQRPTGRQCIHFSPDLLCIQPAQWVFQKALSLHSQVTTVGCAVGHTALAAAFGDQQGGISGHRPQPPTLSQFRSSDIPVNVVPATSILPSTLALLLQGYDESLTSYLVSGFAHGFSTGCVGLPSGNTTRNLPSCDSSQDAVDQYIAAERHAGRIAGPFPIDSQ